jgi:hypothetical protein
LGSWWSSFEGVFSLSLLAEAMMLLQLGTTPDRNKSKQNTTRTRYTDLGQSGGLYTRKFNNKTKAREETGTETSSEASSPLGGAASRGPVPWGGVEPPSSVSFSFLSCDFSYLIKTTKV